jgi:hypothetical protein
MSTRKSVLVSTLSIAIAFTLGVATLQAGDPEPTLDRVTQHETESAGSLRRVSTVADRSTVTAGLSRSGFERELSERFLGTHLLYQTLTEEAKGEVYGHYQDDNDIASIRRIVAHSM